MHEGGGFDFGGETLDFFVQGEDVFLTIVLNEFLGGTDAGWKLVGEGRGSVGDEEGPFGAEGFELGLFFLDGHGSLGFERETVNMIG